MKYVNKITISRWYYICNISWWCSLSRLWLNFYCFYCSSSTFHWKWDYFSSKQKHTSFFSKHLFYVPNLGTQQLTKQNTATMQRKIQIIDTGLDRILQNGKCTKEKKLANQNDWTKIIRIKTSAQTPVWQFPLLVSLLISVVVAGPK